MNPVVFIIFDLSLNHDFFWNWVFHEKIIKNCWGYLEKQTHFLILSQNHCFTLYHQPFLMKKIRKNRFHQISRFRDRSNIIKSLGFIFYAKRMVLNVRKIMHKTDRVVWNFATFWTGFCGFRPGRVQDPWIFRIFPDLLATSTGSFSALSGS